ncbi:uncharacterized protein [Dermacentor andersoni]|uniref:uncharacterized protein isoform X4 n=1 Tax=Dermacentor andersoni TaxID=34620 RepID=UPI0024178674|nr:uncharacterized protein LOC129384594 isoform X4 [Dermacentor andersoni]
MIRDSVPLVPQDGWKWLAVAVILATYGYTQKSVQKCDFDEQERKQLTYCAKKHFDSVILRNLSVKVTEKIIQDVLRRENVHTGCRDPRVISAIEMKVFLNFTTNMVLRNGIKKDKTMLQFSDCFTHLYE